MSRVFAFRPSAARFRILWIIALGLCLLPLGAPAASLISNGDLELNTAGLPNSWTYVQADGPATVQTATNSPFTSVFPLGAAAGLFTDGASSGAGPFLIQSFTTQITPIYVYWDFFFNSPLTGNPWIVQVDDAVTAATRFNLDDSGFFSVEQHTGGKFNVIAMQTNTWYHVDLRLDTGLDSLSGSVTPFGGVASNFTGTFRINIFSLNRLVYGDAPSVAANSSIIVDNFAVSTTPIPEPSTCFLGALGALGISLGLRRRKDG